VEINDYEGVSEAAKGTTQVHVVPVIDKMMHLLDILERKPAGASIRELTAQTDQPRSTIYRILNTLQQHNVVRRSNGGQYHLGPRLLQLASRVAKSGGRSDLIAIAQPILDGLAEQLGESCKLSVVDGQGLLVLAMAQGRREYSLAVTPGQRMPIHVGAAGKLLLAHLPEADRDNLLSQPMASFSPRSITDPERMLRELSRIRRQGWAEDKGESSPSVRAVSAPINDSDGKVIAALSVPFLTGASAARIEEIRTAALNAALRISAAMATTPA
jgi:DNA-binding IclR family transcriptional regulator